MRPTGQEANRIIPDGDVDFRTSPELTTEFTSYAAKALSTLSPISLPTQAWLSQYLTFFPAPYTCNQDNKKV